MHVDIPEELGQLEYFPSRKLYSSGREVRGDDYVMVGLIRGTPVKHQRWTGKKTRMLYSLRKFWLKSKDAK